MAAGGGVLVVHAPDAAHAGGGGSRTRTTAGADGGYGLHWHAAQTSGAAHPSALGIVTRMAVAS